MTRAAMAQVEDENQALRDQISGFETRIRDVHQKLDVLAKSDDHLRLVADLPRIDSDTRQVGVGGVETSASEFGIQDPEIRNMIGDLDKIEREISLQQRSFNEIEKKIIGRQDIVLHTPSIKPVDIGYISSFFGRRKDPFNGRPASHKGLDFSVPRGTPVHATADGRVIFAQQTPGLGRLVVIDHGYGVRTAYGHNSQILVTKGQLVKRGQKIATSGSSGRATAPHCHYEVHVNGNAVDPRDFLFDDNESLANIPEE
jgi:murein DD-endopeptidase MepM/ murein hydrolase activator NlpD